jgi:hypothetical protein
MKRHFRLFAALAVLAAPVSAMADSDISGLVRDAIGLPMKPSDAAAGPWTLRTRDHTICTLTLSAERGPNGVYAAAIPRECGAEIPAGVVGWKPVTDGLALVGPDAVTVLDFNQWTPRDLVARRNGAPYLEMVR